MSAAKHTPGPWYQCGDEVLIDMGDRTHLIATAADWSEETEPNARLLAAAPELLEALEYIYNAHHPDASEHMPELRGITESDFDSLIAEKARAAISKATGSAS